MNHGCEHDRCRARHTEAGGRTPRTRIARLSILPFIAAIWAYRIALGPWLGGQCRFYPTCSQYALDAYRVHGPIRGSWLTARRLLRCHPLGGRGFDPVPERSGSAPCAGENSAQA